MLRDLFRGLIGCPAPSFDENNNRDVWADDLFHGFFREFFDINGPPTEDHHPAEPQDFADDGIDWESSHNDFKFSIFSDTQEMFRHFEEEFRRSFQHFGFVDFPPVGPGMPGIGPSGPGMPGMILPGVPGMGEDTGLYGDMRGTPGESPRSLRDHLLKQPSISDPVRDSDLDDSAKDGNVSVILDSMTPADEGHALTRRPWSQFSMMPGVRGGSSFSSSVSVRTVIGPDGSKELEERRVVRRPDGSSEETISRRRGDEEHMQVRRCLPDGSVEEQGPNNGARRGLLRAPLPDPPAESGQTDSVDNSFWKKLFG